MEHLVVLTGAGISAESGIQTFRDADGLWEGHDVADVATPEAYERNPELVLRFYNQRRRQLDAVKPNLAHELLAAMEKHFRVTIITQNVDDLHERAGSSSIIHLHGELRWGCSAANRELRVFLGSNDIQLGDTAPDNQPLRPDIVWFDEPVPAMEAAVEATLTADRFLVVGTSLQVYPAAGLVGFVPYRKPIVIIDPNRHSQLENEGIQIINQTATSGMKMLFDSWCGVK